MKVRRAWKAGVSACARWTVLHSLANGEPLAPEGGSADSFWINRRGKTYIGSDSRGEKNAKKKMPYLTERGMLS